MTGDLRDADDISRGPQAETVDEAEVRYRALVDSAADAIVTVDAQAVIVAWNPSAERIFGYSEAEALGSPVTLIMPDRYRAMHPRSMAERPGVHSRHMLGPVLELEGRRRDGAEFPIELSLAEWRAGDEQFVTAIVRDVSERAHSGAALRESEARYRSLFEENHAIMLLIDPGTGAIVEVNAAACSWYGWSRDEFLSMRISDINTLTEAEIHAEMDKAVAHERRSFDFRHRRADGTVRDVEVFSGPIERDGSTVLYSLVHDVTERREAEAALRESEAMRDIAEHVARVGSFRRDLDPVAPKATWSNGMYSLFDVHPDEFGGDVLSVLEARAHPADVSRLREVGAQVASGVEPSPIDFRVIHRDGSERVLHTEATFERDASGVPVALTGYYQDVTEERRAERARLEADRKIRRLDRLYATLSAINRAIAHAETKEGLFSAVCRVAVEEGGFRMAWIGGSVDGRVRPLAHSGHEDGYLRDIVIADQGEASRGPAGRAITEGRCVICQDIAIDPAMAPWRDEAVARDYRSLAAVPIREDGVTVGILSVYSGETGAFGSDEEALLEEAGHDISFALDGLRARERARRLEAMRSTAEHVAHVGSFRWDLAGSESAWSPEVYEIFDIAPGEFAGEMPLVLDARVDPGDLDDLRRALAQVAGWGFLPPQEFRIRRRDGGERVLAAGGACERDREGRVVALVGYIQDITEQRESASELRLAHDRFDIAQQAAGAGAFQFHAATRDFTFSPRLYELFGLDPEKAAGSFETLHAVVHPDDREATWEAYRSALVDRTQLRAEYRIVRPSDGEVRWIDSLGEGVYGAGGEPLSLHGLCIDVTERKRMEMLLSVPSEILTVLAEGGPAAEMARRIVAAIKEASGLSAVGLRLREGDDYPFVAASGYPADFLAAENSLASPIPAGGLCREADGRISLECTCGLVITGPRTPGDPLFTPGGSVWTNDSEATEKALADDEPRLNPRNRCVHVGYRSLALVPVRSGDQTLGLLHLADDRGGRFTLESVRFFEGVGASIGTALLRRQAEQDLEESARELRGQLSDTVKAMGAIVGMRDPYTAAHEHRVTLLALAIAERLGFDEKRREGLALAGEVHDIGKVAVPAEILTKPSALSPVEFTLVRMHAEAGRDILSTIHFRQPVAAIVGQHHERLDGSGYPAGLKGDEILPEARVLAVADVVEAMASHRPYRAGLGLERALEEVRSGAGRLYDADVVAACERVMAEGFSFDDE